MAGDALGGGGGAAAVATICAPEAPHKEPLRQQEEAQQDEHLVERSKEMAQHLRHDPPKGGQAIDAQAGSMSRLAVLPPVLQELARLQPAQPALPSGN